MAEETRAEWKARKKKQSQTTSERTKERSADKIAKTVGGVAKTVMRRRNKIDQLSHEILKPTRQKKAPKY